MVSAIGSLLLLVSVCNAQELVCDGDVCTVPDNYASAAPPAPDFAVQDVAEDGTAQKADHEEELELDDEAEDFSQIFHPPV